MQNVEKSQLETRTLKRLLANAAILPTTPVFQVQL